MASAAVSADRCTSSTESTGSWARPESLGGNLPLALGTALAASHRRSQDVTVVFFGDGAVQAGHFNETVNLAALWQLPLIFVCENNGFAEFTPRSAHTVVERVSDVVAPYGFGCETIDGSDAAAVWDAFGEFLRRGRGGEGPFLLECLTHRRRGHYEGDAQEYRDALVDEEWQRRDPIARFEQSAVEQRWLDEAAIDAIRDQAASAVEAAVQFARASPWPDPGLAERLVYA